MSKNTTAPSGEKPLTSVNVQISIAVTTDAKMIEAAFVTTLLVNLLGITHLPFCLLLSLKQE